MSHHDDFETEPVPGLPAHLPEGEHIVWQGAPERTALMRFVFKARWLAFYFAGLALWKLVVGLYDGKSLAEVSGSVIVTAVLGLAVLAIIYGISSWITRSTVYTITNKRVVMRIGMALPITFNLPFTQITSADVLAHGPDTGTLALTLKENTKITWPVLWPHARPWKLAKPQPALRAIADVETVAAHLLDGLRAAHGTEGKAAPAKRSTKVETQSNGGVRILGGLEPKGA